MFVGTLQRECDRQSRKIIEEFKVHRKFSTVISSVRESLSQKTGSSDKYVELSSPDIMMVLASFSRYGL
mgnify:CR=1 FL=1